MTLMRLALTGMLLATPCVAQDAKPFLDTESMDFLESLAKAVLDAARVPANAVIAKEAPNSTGNTLIRPGGREDYPAFWIRDYAMSLDAGIISVEEQRHALFLTAQHQVDTSRILPSGSLLPPGSIPDHISFGGKPIYFPGVVSDYEGQGGARWGFLPCLDDHFFFVHMAAQLAQQTKNTDFLGENVGGKTLLQRLEAAYAMPPSEPETGLVTATEAVRGVNFGFFDSITHTGKLFFASLLKYRAAEELVRLCEARGEEARAAYYKAEGERIAGAIASTFAVGNGWYRASTGLSGQNDVWGTAFAVYIGAVCGDAAKSSCQVLAEGLRKGTIAWNGGIREVPTDGDFSETTAWEKALTPKNQYQNGAYWNTATGWVAYAVAQVDRPLARPLAEDYVKQLRADDFRKGEGFGAPWECMHPEGNHRQNPIYLTSISEPFAAFRRILAEGVGGKLGVAVPRSFPRHAKPVRLPSKTRQPRRRR